jgi:transposase-like protein
MGGPLVLRPDRPRQEMLAERGIDVDGTTIYRWVQRLRRRWEAVAWWPRL